MSTARKVGDNFLTRLRELRKRKGMTQEELAQAARISRISISDLERQKTEPKPATIRRLAQALGCATEDLF